MFSVAIHSMILDTLNNLTLLAGEGYYISGNASEPTANDSGEHLVRIPLSKVHMSKKRYFAFLCSYVLITESVSKHVLQ